jgi:hypothetical protein
MSRTGSRTPTAIIGFWAGLFPAKKSSGDAARSTR